MGSAATAQFPNGQSVGHTYDRPNCLFVTVSLYRPVRSCLWQVVVYSTMMERLWLLAIPNCLMRDIMYGWIETPGIPLRVFTCWCQGSPCFWGLCPFSWECYIIWSDVAKLFRLNEATSKTWCALLFKHILAVTCYQLTLGHRRTQEKCTLFTPKDR